MMGHDWITWLAAIIALCYCAYIMGKEDGQKEGGGLSEEARIEIEKYEIDKKYALYEKMVNADGKPVIQKPMTLGELHALIDAGTEAVAWSESKEDPEIYAAIFYDGRTIDRFAHYLDSSDLCFSAYGKTWRCWASRPTDEERAAAPWEEADNADL